MPFTSSTSSISFPSNLLRPLELSCRSFPNADPLFSMLCGLFCQNTRGGGVLRSPKLRRQDIPTFRRSDIQTISNSFRMRRSKIALLQPLCLPQVRKTGGLGVIMVDDSLRRAPTSARYEVGGLSVKLGQPRFGGGQSGFLFAEGEAHLVGAVARVVVETGAGNGGHADFLNQIFYERNILRSRRETSRVRIGKARNVRHDVVRPAWLGHP